MPTQQLLKELQEILESETDKKFSLAEIARISSNLLGLFELLAMASKNFDDDKNNRK